VSAVSRRAFADYTFIVVGLAAVLGILYVVYRACGVVFYLTGAGGW